MNMDMESYLIISQTPKLGVIVPIFHITNPKLKETELLSQDDTVCKFANWKPGPA